MLLPRALRALSTPASPALGRSSRVERRRVSAWSALGALAIAGLALFHAALLLERLADASIAHPEVLAQWVGALLLAAGAFALRRQGSSLLSGRSALVFWLLVLLLHVGFGSGVTVTGGETGSSRQLLLLLPLAAFAAAATSGVTRRERRQPASARDAVARGFFSLRFDPSPAPSFAGAGPNRFSPRPPPFA